MTIISTRTSMERDSSRLAILLSVRQTLETTLTTVEIQGGGYCPVFTWPETCRIYPTVLINYPTTKKEKNRVDYIQFKKF